MTTKNLSSYTPDEFREGQAAIIKQLTLPLEVHPCKNPQAVLLGGQSGTGKTNLHAVFYEAFDKNVIVINGDEYRSRHPRYHQIDEAYGIDAAQHTATWAGNMTEALIDEFSRVGHNLIVEGTLHTAEVPLKTATLLRSRGYRVSLALMAVKPEISLVSCQIRYELMRIAGTIPRAVDPKHHDRIVRDIVSNLSALEQSGLFDEVRLFSRTRECLYPRAEEDRTAGQALQEILFGSWTSEETDHHARLQDQLARLKDGEAT